MCIFESKISLKMESLTLKNKLKEQFIQILNDDSKLAILDGVFDALTTSENYSKVSEEQYQIIEERRQKYLSGESKGMSWDEIKVGIKDKYGF